MSRPYRPANGTDGYIFIEDWCAHCERDDEYQRTGENGCEILAKTFALPANDPDYPTQWICDDNGDNARCTAFVDDAADYEPCPLVEDKRQMRLFE